MEVYTVKQVAEILQINEHSVLALVHSGEFGTNISNSSRPRWRIHKADLESFLLRRSKAIQSPAPKQVRREPCGVEYF